MILSFVAVILFWLQRDFILDRSVIVATIMGRAPTDPERSRSVPVPFWILQFWLDLAPCA